MFKSTQSKSPFYMPLITNIYPDMFNIFVYCQYEWQQLHTHTNKQVQFKWWSALGSFQMPNSIQAWVRPGLSIYTQHNNKFHSVRNNNFPLLSSTLWCWITTGSFFWPWTGCPHSLPNVHNFLLDLYFTKSDPFFTFILLFFGLNQTYSHCFDIAMQFVHWNFL